MTETPIRVVLADDADMIRKAIGVLLAVHGFEVVTQAVDPAGLHEAVATHQPDVAVVDIRTPPTWQREGLAAALDIRQSHPNVGVLLLSQYRDPHYLNTLFGGGARGVGYLLKERLAEDDFLDAPGDIADGCCAVDPEVVTLMINSRGCALCVLSTREREVLALMAQGRANLGTAQLLNPTLKTVESHVASIFRKLKLPDPRRPPPSAGGTGLPTFRTLSFQG